MAYWPSMTGSWGARDEPDAGLSLADVPRARPLIGQ